MRASQLPPNSGIAAGEILPVPNAKIKESRPGRLDIAVGFSVPRLASESSYFMGG
jgi:hypothetical protein